MKTYIYESPDDGKTIYRREFDKEEREVLNDGKWNKETKWWDKKIKEENKL